MIQCRYFSASLYSSYPWVCTTDELTGDFKTERISVLQTLRDSNCNTLSRRIAMMQLA